MRNGIYLARISHTCCGITIGMGVLTFVGWLSGLRLLASIRQDYIPMAPNTAAAFIILGISVLVLTFRSLCRFSRWFSAFSAIVTIALSILTLIQYFVRVDHLNIDQMILNTSGVLGKVPVGCMSPITGGKFSSGGCCSLVISVTLLWKTHTGYCVMPRRSNDNHRIGGNSWIPLWDTHSLWR